MIRPLRICLALTAICAGLLVGAGQSQAADASCAIHIPTIDWWSTGNSQINGDMDFKCGGAQSGHNGDYYVAYELQDSVGDGNWVRVGCINGHYCTGQRPTSGLYGGGEEHQWFWTFNVNGRITCLYWRIHVTVVYPYIGDQDNYNDQVHIGGC